MVVYPPPTSRHRSRPPKQAPAGLTLVSAAYVPSTSLELTFDRPIDITHLAEHQIHVNDGVAVLQFETIPPATQTGPASVRFDLLDVKAWGADDVRLNATADTGIRAANDRGTWAGVTDVVLPLG